MVGPRLRPGRLRLKRAAPVLLAILLLVAVFGWAFDSAFLAPGTKPKPETWPARGPCLARTKDGLQRGTLKQ